MINYFQTVKDSQFYPELDMIIRSLKSLRHRVSNEIPKPVEKNGITMITMTSPQQDLDYILVGLENTKKQGYKLTNDEYM